MVTEISQFSSVFYAESKEVKLIEPETRMVAAGGVGKMERCWSKAQTFSDKMNEFWGSMMTIPNCILELYTCIPIAYLTFAKRIYLKCSY